MDSEIWKDIVGFEGLYQVSNVGRVRSIGRNYYDHYNKVYSYLKRDKAVIKAQQYYGGKDYPRTVLYKMGRSHLMSIHRAVAEAFIPNPGNLPTVNHKNGIRTDNRVENLEWCSYSDNLIHSMYVLNRIEKLGKPVMCVETGERFRSIGEAAKEKGLSFHCLRAHLKGRMPSLHGQHWVFIDKTSFQNNYGNRTEH